MIRAETMTSGGVPLTERDDMLRRIRAQRSATSGTRYCENPECRILQLTGTKQKLSAYNLLDELGREERLCCRCQREGVVLAPKEGEKRAKSGAGTSSQGSASEAEKCKRGHLLAQEGRYRDGSCCKCARERARERAKALRMAEPDYEARARGDYSTYVHLRSLRYLKESLGVTYLDIAEAVGRKEKTLGKWASQGQTAPPEVVPLLANYFGVTEDEIVAEPPRSATGHIYLYGLREVMEDYPITLDALCEKANIPRGTLKNYRTKHRPAPPHRVAKLAEVLGCSEAKLTG